MIKRIGAFIFIFILSIQTCYGVSVVKDDFSPDKTGLSTPPAQGGVLIEMESGRVLYGLNHNTPLPMASTTKIMTAIVALSMLPIDRVVRVHKSAVGCEGSSIYLYEGEEITVQDLIYGLMLESANDAALALAIECCGNSEDFAKLMNKTARDMGLENTNFTNPHGLYDKNHYTSPRDLAEIARHALSHPFLREVMATRVYRTHNRVMSNHNRLLSSYKGAIGLKTGYTMASGRCLVSAAERNGTVLIAVTLNCRDDWRAHTSMLDWGFSVCRNIELIGEGVVSCAIPVTGGDKTEIEARTRDSVNLITHTGDITMTYCIYVNHMMFAPIKEGQALGTVEVFVDNKSVATLPLYATQSIESVQKELSFFEKLMESIRRIFKLD